MNILIIEKNRAFAQEIATLLRIPHSHGIETSVANSWEEGLECIEVMDEGPNLIIYDGSELKENPTICDSLPDYFKSRLMLFTVNPADEGLPYPFVLKPEMHTLKLAVKRFFRLDPVPPPQHKPPRVLIAFHGSETRSLVETIAHGHGFNCTQSDNPLAWLTGYQTRRWDHPTPDIIICNDLVFYNQLPPDLKDKCIIFSDHPDMYRGQLHANCPLLDRPQQLHERLKAEMALTPWRIQLTKPKPKGGLCIQPSRVYVTAFEEAFHWPSTEDAQQIYQEIATLCKRCDELYTAMHLKEMYPCPVVIGELTLSEPEDRMHVHLDLLKLHMQLMKASSMFGLMPLNQFWSSIVAKFDQAGAYSKS